ncbi:MAG: hypothetical protein KC656_19740, partial [Myxococcales bacterium]|nr:hypothetical protein [Myxococcales bacterium]
SERLAADAHSALREATRAGKPTLVFLNKVDRPHDVSEVLEAVRSASERPVVPVEAVLAEGGRCAGVVDLLSRQVACLGEDGAWEEHDPQRWMTRPWEQLTEAVALTDDALLEDYLEYLELPDDEVREGLRRALAGGRIVPVLFGAAGAGFGVDRLLDFLVVNAPDALSGEGPMAHEYDGTPVRVGPSHGFVAQLVATQLDQDGAAYQVLRVWSGQAPLNKAWVHGDTGCSAKVRKLYRLRGPRRAAAKTAGAGALVATWDLLPGRPGDTFTAGERLVVAPPDRPPVMMAYALRPCSAADERRMREGLELLLAMDGGIELHTDQTTGDLLLGGASEAQLEWALARLARLGVNARGELPPIPYREVPAHAVRNIEGVHRLEDRDGLPVEYGACNVDVEPRQDERIGFEDAFPDAEELPRKFRPAIDEGVRKALEHGPMAGYPVLGAHVRLTGGQYDILQSTEDHFRIAGELAARRALEEAGTRLLEPWWQVDVYAPSGDIGSVISEVAQRRGRVVGLEVLGEETRLCAQVPYRELRTFGPRLESVCAGRARFFGEASHYEQAPDHLVDEAIRSSPFRRAS